jgi:hypothetical protein
MIDQRVFCSLGSRIEIPWGSIGPIDAAAGEEDFGCVTRRGQEEDLEEGRRPVAAAGFATRK